ncbi:putative efflux transporter [Fictibacillus macauensis ZFHKF-1]|uniref:Putative efflux transporter n=1 Tax=Fictibacillus macauensis ZFHKF-1 TaxID=1196324 RepID=I8AIM0_9BACL|nr:MFS transporter [Fictibacillus macauensis]EIT85572.1 putative efflux transporter [Fictibacillus macauensis ZFHKF-1]
MKPYSKEERSWMYYDWANSAYSIIITTAVFPLFYKAAATNAGIRPADSTAYLGYTLAITTFILALLGPILGTIADYKGLKKRFFTFFFSMGILSTAALVFIPSDDWMLLLIFYTLTALGFNGSIVFYDAFIVDVTTEARMNNVSARGFALGYVGGTIPFLLAIAIIVLAQNEWIPLSVVAASRIAFLLTAVWWGLFAIPLFRNVKQLYYVEREPRLIRASFKRLGNTFKQIRAYKSLFLFLFAYFFFIDGVGTIISLATAYGTDLGISSTSLLIILFINQVVAAPCAILYGKLAEKYTGKVMLYVGIIIYIFVCIYAYFLRTTLDFWIIAMLVSSSQGGIQAISRAYFAKLVPKHNANEFFGFYSIFGKFASVLGPLLVGITAQVTGNTSSGVFSLIFLFLIGMILLAYVPSDKKLGATSMSDEKKVEPLT